MSVKWNLYAELRNNQEALDERMEKQVADNNRLMLTLTQAAACLPLFFWVFSEERDWFKMWWIICMVFWLPLLFEGALEWYSGTVMVKWPPPASLIARLRQGVGLVLAIPRQEVGRAKEVLCRAGERAYIIGSVVKGEAGVELV